MRRSLLTIILSVGLMLLWRAGDSGAQPVVETGPEAEITGDRLYRVDPSIMDAAWVSPDLDLSRYTRILFTPTAVQFREMSERQFSVARTDTRTEFPVDAATRARLSEQ